MRVLSLMEVASIHFQRKMSPSMECSNEKADDSPAGKERSREMTSGNQEAEMTLRDAAELTPEKESNVTFCPSPP